ncbi:MAG: SpoVA/SpoVAEb family sporulation membrane protein [Acholeplasmatales bacterium]|nr:SpoVA/SpoVAEb family sporulation membrane protein [Acholeplasmatales bacterium]
MTFLLAFLVGGAICGLAQIIKDITRLTVGHMTSLFVILGVFLDFGNTYDKLIDVAGAGALLPITSFGHSLVDASYSKALDEGFLGIFTGIFEKTAGGIALALTLSVIIGLIFKPKK